MEKVLVGKGSPGSWYVARYACSDVKSNQGKLVQWRSGARVAETPADPMKLYVPQRRSWLGRWDVISSHFFLCYCCDWRYIVSPSGPKIIDAHLHTSFLELESKRSIAPHPVPSQPRYLPNNTLIRPDLTSFLIRTLEVAIVTLPVCTSRTLHGAWGRLRILNLSCLTTLATYHLQRGGSLLGGCHNFSEPFFILMIIARIITQYGIYLC